jgi:hypothetical protein
MPCAGYSDLQVYLLNLEVGVGILQRSTAISAVVLAAMPMVAFAAGQLEETVSGFCCLGGDHGQEALSTGLGQSHPSVADLSLDPSWRVYRFKRDGIEYFQVNDLGGRVQLIVGSLDGLLWALPAGEASTQLVLPPQRIVIPQTVIRSEVYLHPSFSIARYRAGDSVVWSVEVSSAAH